MQEARGRAKQKERAKEGAERGEFIDSEQVTETSGKLGKYNALSGNTASVGE